MLTFPRAGELAKRKKRRIAWLAKERPEAVNEKANFHHSVDVFLRADPISGACV